MGQTVKQTRMQESSFTTINIQRLQKGTRKKHSLFEHLKRTIHRPKNQDHDEIKAEKQTNVKIGNERIL
jgi:hypothetical protein